MKPFLFIGIGLFTAGCAAADFDWFMNNYRARIFVSMFGRDGARMVYVALGIGFLGFGGYLLTQQS